MFPDMAVEVGFAGCNRVRSALPASLLASAALHALVLALAMRLAGTLAMPPGFPHATLIPVSLISVRGGGGGLKGNGQPAPLPVAVVPTAPSTAAVDPATLVPLRVARKAKRAPEAAPPAPPAPPPLAATSAPGAGLAGAAGPGGTGTGAGDGSGGDGSGGASAGYGANPRPSYPLAARRLGLEGRVLLEVVVAPDGRPTSVRVRESSGHEMLDDSAAETVRTRWRFVPARRDGVPVESTVTVPIRFRIREG